MLKQVDLAVWFASLEAALSALNACFNAYPACGDYERKGNERGVASVLASARPKL